MGKTTRKKISMRALLVVSALSIVVLSVVVSGVTSIIVTYNAAEETAYSSLADKAGISAASMKRREDVLKKELLIESTNSEVGAPGLSVERQAVILKLASNISDYQGFILATMDGETYDSDGKINISDREYFKAALEGKPIISNPLIQRRDNALALMSAAKLVDGSGVVVGVIPYDAFNTSLKDIQIGDNGFVYMLDKNGVVIMYPVYEVTRAMGTFTDYAATEGLSTEDVNYYTALGKQSDKILDTGSGSEEFKANGITYLITFLPVDVPEGWYVVSIVPKKEMFESFYSQLTITIVSLLAMIIIAALLSLGFSQLLTRPIKSISGRLRKLAEGDLALEAKLSANTGDFQNLGDLLQDTTSYMRDYVGDIDYVLGHIADGDLNVQSRVEYVGDFVGIGESLNHIQSRLNEVIRTLVDSTRQITVQSEQISDNAQSLADGSVSSSSSLKHLVDTMVDVTDSINTTVAKTTTAGELSASAKKTAADGTDKVHHLLASIGDITSAASSIERINNVIEEIAFQTNILALNATIEAARAGTAGKSFGVVADEVRSLAARCAQASGETSELIAQVLAAISEGSASAGAAAETFEEIQESVNNVDELMASIAQLFEHQAGRITELNHDIDRISSVTDASSTASIELAATSKSFEGQAGMLSRIVAGFKLRN